MLDQGKQGGQFVSERAEKSPFKVAKRGRSRPNHRKKVTDPDSGLQARPHQSDTSPKNKTLSKAILDRSELREKDQEPWDALDLRVNKQVFGTSDLNSIHALLDQVILVSPEYDKSNSRNLEGALATMRSIAPNDALEGLLTVQMIGVHNMAMRCLSCALLEGQTPEAMDANVHRAVRLLRTFTSQMEALNRHRGKVGQAMVVGNVNVNDGGQAIVGPVSHPGRDEASIK